MAKLSWRRTDHYDGIGSTIEGRELDGDGLLTFKIDPWGHIVVNHQDGWFDTYEAGTQYSGRDLAVTYWRKYRLSPSPGPDEIRGLDSLAEEVFNND